MNVSLTPEIETMIDEKVKSGRYGSASEVILEGLKLLQDQGERNERRLAELRIDVQSGFDQIDTGEYVEYASTDELTRRILSEGQRKAAELKRSG